MIIKGLLKRFVIVIPTSFLMLNMSIAMGDYDEPSSDQTEYYEENSYVDPSATAGTPDNPSDDESETIPEAEDMSDSNNDSTSADSDKNDIED